MTNHTPEPWSHGTALIHKDHQIFKSSVGDPIYIADVKGPNAREDAARIVECVNAMRDIQRPSNLKKIEGHLLRAIRILFNGIGKETTAPAVALNELQAAHRLMEWSGE